MYGNTQITVAINESYQLVNSFCGVNIKTVAVPGGSVANQVNYSTPSPIMIPMELYFNGRQMRKLSLGALGRNYRSWLTDNTTKNGPVARWTPTGIKTFAIHPADAVGGQSITITGVIEPTLLSSGSNVLEIEDEYLTMMLELTVHRLQLKEGGKIFSDSSTMMLNSFYKRLANRTRFTGWKSPTYRVLTGPTQ